MALTVAQQQEVRGAFKTYLETVGAALDNNAASPAIATRRLELYNTLLGPLEIYISDEKFWSLFDDMWMYIVAGGRIVNQLLTNAGIAEVDAKSYFEGLIEFRASLP